MKLLITGGCGYLGGFLVKYLEQFADKIEEIRLYDNLSRGDLAFLFGQDIVRNKVVLIQHDILDRRSLLKALDGVDTVIHLAAKIVQPYTDIALHQFDQINNWGSSNVADAIQESTVKKVIYLSSITVYGSHNQLVTSNTAPEPQNAYGQSKLNGEKHFQRLVDKEVYILRCANVYGYSPTMRIDSVVNRFMFEAHHKGKVNRIGDGLQSRAFISLESFAAQLSYVLFQPLACGVYNMADQNLRINEIIEVYLELFPQLDVITVDQNSTLQSVIIEIPTRLALKMNHKSSDLREVLNSFQAEFSF